MNFKYLLLGLFLLNVSCNKNIAYKGNKDLIGYWEATTVEIVDPNYNAVRFPMGKYGYSEINFNDDSIYSFRMEIHQDVILEKEVLGNQFEKVILKAGYTNYKQGFYFASDTSIILYDGNKLFSDEYRYDFQEQHLFTYFTDKASRKWKIKWEK